MKKLFVLCTMLLWVAINALAQQKISVSGIVTDENKEPVIGANVSVKDVPGLGTITDLNGRYVIKVNLTIAWYFLILVISHKKF